jgi:hypothetical protein
MQRLLTDIQPKRRTRNLAKRDCSRDFRSRSHVLTGLVKYQRFILSGVRRRTFGYASQKRTMDVSIDTGFPSLWERYRIQLGSIDEL